MKKHGKKYRAALEKIGDPNKARSLPEAVNLIKTTSPTKFDATIEIHLRTGCDPKQADEMVRAVLVLPHGTGKSKRIAVFGDATEQEKAKKAGAEVVGGEELITKVEKGNIDFEVAIATPEMMKKLAKAAKVLGPKGLMPSPKSGTVTTDVTKAVEEIKKGKIEFKLDKQSLIHSILGKTSFSESAILENLKAFLKALKEAKPSGVKGTYIESMYLTTSMGPSVALNISEAMSV
ncbi:50S ribosomal protein L1 [Candidatus Peregrinibacteria bacterium]|nr:50S ribosomal protein L1 [Candidatus Peregrinibacteria bacterium]